MFNPYPVVFEYNPTHSKSQSPVCTYLCMFMCMYVPMYMFVCVHIFLFIRMYVMCVI